MRLNFDGLDFNTNTPDASGTYWYITEMEGWDSPALRQSFGTATSRNGQVILESMLDSRPVILRGVVKATSEANFWIAYNDLLGLTNNLVTTKDLTVYETIPKRIGVIRGGSVKITFVGVGAFTFEIPLTAPDPLKYSL